MDWEHPSVNQFNRKEKQFGSPEETRAYSLMAGKKSIQAHAQSTSSSFTFFHSISPDALFQFKKSQKIPRKTQTLDNYLDPLSPDAARWFLLWFELFHLFCFWCGGNWLFHVAYCWFKMSIGFLFDIFALEKLQLFQWLTITLQ